MPSGSCISAVTGDSALSECAAVGSRLCTLSELESGAARGTGCGFDSTKVWTQDSCTNWNGEPGFKVANGSDGSGALCRTGDETANVRCCADACDEPLNDPVMPSALCCSELPAAFRTTGASAAAGVCAASEPTGSCLADVSKASAAAECEAAGARLCTLSEVQAWATKGSGCGFDNHMIWTQDQCTDASGAAGYMSAKGSDGSGAKCAMETETASMRCCADIC
eukprot:scaffold543694_cov41-Prasinocladus_malaysianus.AAC.1